MRAGTIHGAVSVIKIIESDVTVPATDTEKTMNEKDLIEKAKEKNPNAISTLYNQNIKMIYRFVLYKTNHKEIAEDLTSEVFVRAFEKVESFKGNSSFKTWLYVIAKNLIIEWYRNKDKTTELIYEPNGTQNLEDEVEEESRNLKLETCNSEEELLISKIFNNLDNDKYKRVLELRFLLNYTIKETAEELKISEGNVKVIQNRALKKARNVVTMLKQSGHNVETIL